MGGKSEGKLTLWKQDYPLLFVVYSSFFYTPDFGKLISEVLKFGKIAFIGSGVCRIVISTRRGKQLTKEEVPVVYEPAVPEALNKK